MREIINNVKDADYLCRSHLVWWRHVVEDLVFRDLDIGGAGGGVPGVVVGHLGVGGVDPGGGVLLSVDLSGGDRRDRRERPHRGTGRQVQGLPRGSTRDALLQGEEGRLDAFLGDEGVLVDIVLSRVATVQLLYLGGRVEVELLGSELAGPALDLVEELHRDGEDVVLGT